MHNNPPPLLLSPFFQTFCPCCDHDINNSRLRYYSPDLFLVIFIIRYRNGYRVPRYHKRFLYIAPYIFIHLTIPPERDSATYTLQCIFVPQTFVDVRSIKELPPPSASGAQLMIVRLKQSLHTLYLLFELGDCGVGRGC